MRIVTFGTRKLVNFGKSLYMRLVRTMAFTVHSNVSYPGALGPGTARISDLPVSQGSSSNHVSYHLFDEVSLAAIARVQDKQESTDGNVWITQVDSDQ